MNSRHLGNMFPKGRPTEMKVTIRRADGTVIEFTEQPLLQRIKSWLRQSSPVSREPARVLALVVEWETITIEASELRAKIHGGRADEMAERILFSNRKEN